MALKERNGKWEIRVSRTIPGKRAERRSFRLPLTVPRKEAEAIERDAAKRWSVGLEIDSLIPDKTALKRGDGLPTLEAAFKYIDKRFWTGLASQAGNWKNALMAMGFFGKDASIADITAKRADEYIQHLIEKGYKPSTVHGKWAAVSKMLTHYVKIQELASRPYPELPEIGDNNRKRVFTAAERAQIEPFYRYTYVRQRTDKDGVTPDDWADFFIVFVDTGIRPEELRKLPRGRLRDRRLHISGAEAKTNKSRTVPATQRVEEAWLRQTARATERGQSFPFEFATEVALDGAWQPFRRVMGMAKDPHFTPYMCRHDCITRVVRESGLAAAKEWAGHSSVQTTMGYVHLAPTDLDAARDALEKPNALRVKESVGTTNAEIEKAIALLASQGLAVVPAREQEAA
jgi:integrase